jgi:hypothetical protein
MIDQLRELAEAEPFKRFAINMRSGKSYLVNRRADIGFTDHGKAKNAQRSKTVKDCPGYANGSSGASIKARFQRFEGLWR